MAFLQKQRSPAKLLWRRKALLSGAESDASQTDSANIYALTYSSEFIDQFYGLGFVVESGLLDYESHKRVLGVFVTNKEDTSYFMLGPVFHYFFQDYTQVSILNLSWARQRIYLALLIYWEFLGLGLLMRTTLLQRMGPFLAWQFRRLYLI